MDLYSGRGFLKIVLAIAAVAVAYFAVFTLFEAPFAPWARSFGLWSTLTGEWSGELRRPDGSVNPVYFQIELTANQRCPGCAGFHGYAKVCAPEQPIQHYDISGHVDNWRGSRFHFSFTPSAEEMAGLPLGALRGEWQDDVMQATGHLVTPGRTATIAMTRSSDVPAPAVAQYTLRRGTQRDFLSGCESRRTLP